MDNKNLLWELENSLRGTVDKTECQNLIVGMLFYRFLSEKVQDQNLPIPDDLKFNEISKKVANGKLRANNLIEVLRKIQLGFSEEFNDLFTDAINTLTTLNNRVDDISATIRLIIEQIDSLNVVDDQIFDDFLDQIALQDGKRGDEHHSPKSIRKLLASIAQIYNYSSLMDLSLGNGSTLIAAGAGKDKINYFGEEINESTARTAKINLIMHGIMTDQINIKIGDSLLNDIFSNQKSEMVISTPPISMRWHSELLSDDPRFKMGVSPRSKADFAFLQNALYHLSSDGHALLLTSHGVLFRSGSEAKIRQAMIDQGLISTVIGLPANLLTGSSIPVALMIFSNQPMEDILFIDASREFEKNRMFNELSNKNIDKITETVKLRKKVARYSYVATLKEVQEKDYNLNIARYVDTYQKQERVNITKLNQRLETVKANEKNAKQVFQNEYAKARILVEKTS